MRSRYAAETQQRREYASAPHIVHNRFESRAYIQPMPAIDSAAERERESERGKERERDRVEERLGRESKTSRAQ